MVGMDEMTYAPDADVALEDGEPSEIPTVRPDGDFGFGPQPWEPAESRLSVFAARDPDEDEEEEDEDLDFFDDDEEDDDDFDDDDFDDEEFEEGEEEEEEEDGDDDEL